jgi:UMF1 family MFS transporter
MQVFHMLVICVGFVLPLNGAEFYHASCPACAPKNKLPHQRSRRPWIRGVTALFVMLLLLAENDQGVTLLGVIRPVRA